MKLKRLLSAMLPMLFCIAAFAQDKVVEGKVTNAKDGSPLVGATVSVKGTNIATSTGKDGSYKIKVPQNATTLVISYVGFGDQEVAIGSNMNVSLKVMAVQETEVVVIGYGAVKKKELTGAVSTVGTKDFQQGAISTPEQLIAGKVAGVSVTSNGGQPGSGSVIRIRGGASLNASNDPLIVIDGVPLSGDGISGAANALSLINPNDIETFTILKDAASTAIYGSRASNGVIMITTKRGRSGKAVFNFSTANSYSKKANSIKVMSADQFRTLVDAQGTPSQIALMGSSNTDWQKAIFQEAVGTTNNLSVSGSMKNLPYRVSVGYTGQQGILMTNTYQRTSASIKLSPSLLDNHLKIDFNVNGSVANSRFADQGAIGSAISFDPTQPIYKTGSPFGGYFEWLSNATTPNPNATRNPVASLQQKLDKGEVDRAFGNVQLDYKLHFLPELRANLNLGFDEAKGHGTVYIPQNATIGYNSVDSLKGANNKYLQHVNNRVMEFYLNYTKDLKSIKSNINATAGYGYYDFLTTNYSYNSYSAIGDTIPGTTPTYPIDKPRHTLISYYGRLVFTYNSKYIIAASLRTDGSSKFAKNNRWGTFPSVAFSWRVNQEDFLKNNKTISDLKLRLSYGVTGQQDGLAYYSYIPSYYTSSANSQYQFGNTYYYTIAPSAYVANLKWEQTAAYNAGLDYGILKNRITGSVDFYYKKTKDLLATVPIPAGSNFTNQVTTNVGNMETKGVEFSINATLIQNKDLKWDVGANVTYNQSKITNLSLPGAKDSSAGTQTGGIAGATGNNIQINSVGYAPNAFYVYRQVYNTSGNPIEGLYDDVNRDGTITDKKDKYHYKSPAPKVILGFTTQLDYKQWSFSTVLRGNFGNYVYNNVASNLAVSRAIINPNNYLQNAPTAYYKTGFYNNQYYSDYYVENASFVRMDNFGIGYNVGKVFNNKASLKLGLNCQNVFVITKYSGLDPEVFGGIDYNLYPRPRIYTLTANLNF